MQLSTLPTLTKSKAITFAATALCAFMMPAIVHAAILPVPASHAAMPVVRAAVTAVPVSHVLVASDSITIRNLDLRNVILDQPDHRDDALTKPQTKKSRQHNSPYAGNSGSRSDPGDPVGGSPTPEPSSVLLFAVGLSALILVQRHRTVSKRREAETSRNS